MKNQLTTFSHELFNEVRVSDQDGNPWFIAKDICSNLGLTQVSKAMASLDDDEKGITNVPTLGGPQDLAMVNESGLWSLVLRSRKPEAKKFKKWITSEVIPSIRKTGSYSVTPQIPLSELPTHLETAKLLVATLEENEVLKVKNAEMTPKAEFFDTVTASEDVCSIAKAAQVADLGFGQNILFRKLRADGVLITTRARYNDPKQKYIDQGLFTLEEKPYVNGNGEDKMSYKTHVTQKGIAWLIKKYRNPEPPTFGLVS